MMTLRKLTLTALAVGLAGTVSGIATVQAAPPSANAQLKAWDSDQDGSIDMAEAKKAAEAKFNRLDTDHDGTLDMMELASTGIHKMSFSKADSDKDGTLDKSEYLNLVEARFNAADPDHDGTISQAELSTRSGQALARLL
jgi:Ca2+-binding EF-hand superfamily protein